MISTACQPAPAVPDGQPKTAVTSYAQARLDPPRWLERWSHALVLFLLFALCALLLPVLNLCAQVYCNLDLGELPQSIEVVFWYRAWVAAHPWIVPAAMFVLAWLWFSFVGVSRIRMRITSAVILWAILLGGGWLAYELLRPLWDF